MRKKTDDSLYQRGRYSLFLDRKRDGTLRTPVYQIGWYDPAAGRQRSRSTGSTEIAAAERALDAFYLKTERGENVCPTCHRPFDDKRGLLLTVCISDYITAKAAIASADSLKPRLAHVVNYLIETDQVSATCDDVDESFVEAFRTWLSDVPVVEGVHRQTTRRRAPGTVEASIRQLAAAINFAHRRKATSQPAGFSAKAARLVSHPPTFRLNIDQLAATFDYCLRPKSRDGTDWSDVMVARQATYRLALLRFLQASVATWARPDSVYDISTDPKRGQWISDARVLLLNPIGRAQTNKYRPTIPVPDRFARLLDQTSGFFVPVQSIRKAYESMADELGFPKNRQAGTKLIRRSMATLARKRIGEANWRQGEMMLGHVEASISDLYAIPDPANLGLALRATEEIITDIERRCLGAFTGKTPELKMVLGGKVA